MLQNPYQTGQNQPAKSTQIPAKKYVNFRNNAKIGISYRGHFGKPIQIWPNLWLELSASGKTT